MIFTKRNEQPSMTEATKHIWKWNSISAQIILCPCLWVMEFWQSGLLLVVNELQHKMVSKQTRVANVAWWWGVLALWCVDETGKDRKPSSLSSSSWERNRRENETRGRGASGCRTGNKTYWVWVSSSAPSSSSSSSSPKCATWPLGEEVKTGGGDGEGREKERRIRTENRIGAYKEIEGQGKQAKVTTGEKRERREKGGRSEWGSNP